MPVLKLERNLEIVRLRDEEHWTWRKIARFYDLAEMTVRDQYFHQKRRNELAQKGGEDIKKPA